MRYASSRWFRSRARSIVSRVQIVAMLPELHPPRSEGLCCNALYGVATCCTVLQRVVRCCNVLHSGCAGAASSSIRAVRLLPPSPRVRAPQHTAAHAFCLEFRSPAQVGVCLETITGTLCVTSCKLVRIALGSRPK